VAVSNAKLDTGGGDVVGQNKAESNFFGPTFFTSMPEQPAKASSIEPQRRLPLLPYLTNRVEQQRNLEAALQEQFDRGAVRPMTFFIVGKDDECLDSFVEQIYWVRLPEFLESNSRPTNVVYRSLQWVSGETLVESSAADIDRQLLDVKSQVVAALGLKVSADILADEKKLNPVIEQKLASSPVMCVFHIALAVADWNGAQEQALAAWIGWLASLKVSNARCPVVTLVGIVYPSRWLSALWWGKAVLAMRRDIDKLGRDAVIGPSVRALPELKSVRLQDVEHWITEYVENADREELRRIVRRRFSAAFGFGQRRMSMYRAALVVKAALSNPSVRMSVTP
jgi:hypothetical protein